MLSAYIVKLAEFITKHPKNYTRLIFMHIMRWVDKRLKK